MIADSRFVQKLDGLSSAGDALGYLLLEVF